MKKVLPVVIIIALAAVVMGGASLFGGRGTITGTIVGTLLISFLRNGCALLGISINAHLIVIGWIIILAVALDRLARSKSSGPSAFGETSPSGARQ